jgi:hypothetical protein
MATENKLAERLRFYDKIMRDIGACGDGYCLVTGKATGQHTNGGCRCWMNKMTAQRVMRAARLLRDDLETLAN